MQTEEILKEAKSRLTEFRSNLEEAGMKATLGASEARDAFEREWDKFSVFMEEQGRRLRRQSAWANRLVAQITERIGRLKNLVIAETPTAERQYNGWREQVMRTIYELEFLIHEIHPMLDEGERELFGTLRVRMEIYRTHLVLNPYDKLTDLNEMAIAIAAGGDEVLQWHTRMEELSHDRSERIREELNATFTNLKNAFSAFFK